LSGWPDPGQGAEDPTALLLITFAQQFHKTWYRGGSFSTFSRQGRQGMWSGAVGTKHVDEGCHICGTQLEVLDQFIKDGQSIPIREPAHRRLVVFLAQECRISGRLLNDVQLRPHNKTNQFLGARRGAAGGEPLGTHSRKLGENCAPVFFGESNLNCFAD
jgi:hypothetical protein